MSGRPPPLPPHASAAQRAQSPAFQALGNAGLRHQRDNADFVLQDRPPTRAPVLLAGCHEPYPRPPSKHRGRRPYPREQSQIQPTLNQLTGVINGLVTAARSRRLPKLFQRGHEEEPVACRWPPEPTRDRWQIPMVFKSAARASANWSSLVLATSSISLLSIFAVWWACFVAA